jgi:hypothetical protein
MVPDLRPRGIGEILDSAVALYRARFKKLVLVAAVVVVPVQVLSAIVLLSAQPKGFSLSVTGSVTPQYDSSSFAVQFAATVVVAIVGVLSTALIVAVSTRIVADAYIGRSSETRDAVHDVRPRAWAVVGTSLIVLLTEGLGIVFCFVGVLVPLTLFAVAVPVLILEGVGVGAAIGRSVTLTKGHALHVLGMVLTAQLLAAILNVGLVLAVHTFLTSGGSTVAAVIAQSIANTIAGVLTTPFVATAIVVLYFDLRIRDEAYDVQLLIQRSDARIAAA